MVKTKKSKKVGPPQPARRAERTGMNTALALLKSFGCGMGAMLLIGAAAAAVFSRTALSLELVKPAACGAVAVGALLSGLVLADSLAQRRLLCGLGCGAFYAVCLIAATGLSGQVPVFDRANLFLLGVTLAGGTAGGIVSAAFGTPQR